METAPGRKNSKVWKSKSKGKAVRKKSTRTPKAVTTPACQMETFCPKQEDINGFFSGAKQKATSITMVEPEQEEQPHQAVLPPMKQEKEFFMTHQDAINSSFEVSKNMTEYMQEMYLKKHLRSTCHQKTPTPPTIDGVQQEASPADHDTEMEEMVRNVEHHKEMMKPGDHRSCLQEVEHGQGSATPVQEGTEPEVMSACRFYE